MLEGAVVVYILGVLVGQVAPEVEEMLPPEHPVP
jgi:hypothetical protein